ncbi:short chain dehydrogenase/reductase [Bordetella ansorpii]|uniref:Short chain dehydrogenase/reductase n=1 Tax=Bordetella ansorpii TaxID=288768 RepID=A0A157PDG1_9BORD|nr:SDR family oxidoreductase [Bordetella ansorpii]SAI31518.1 short chain dehydrogenase/reductase [Bordetella ansorpii]
MSNATDLTGQVVVITGAAGDLGWGIACQCLQAGANVALVDLDMVALQERGAPGDPRLLRVQCDVADPAQTRAVVQSVLSRWDRLDVLVNNAAVVTPGDKIGDLACTQWHQALAINLTGAWLMSKAALVPMRRAGRGVVLNVASQLGSVAAPGRGAYGASKAGLIALARAIAVDHADEGIRALSLSPGAVLTSRVLRRYGDAESATTALAGRYPAGRLGNVEEVARTALFLMGEGAAFITGTDVRVDGGYSAI